MCIETTPKRISLVTAKDISNIERSFNLDINGKRHDDDATSVKLWVESMKFQENNPVLHYYHSDESFQLVLQSAFQSEMLKKLAPEKVVCIDDTHGTNAYNLHLTTLMVLDELEEGFAAGWFICNNIDTSSMQIFFDAIKEKLALHGLCQMMQISFTMLGASLLRVSLKNCFVHGMYYVLGDNI